MDVVEVSRGIRLYVVRQRESFVANSVMKYNPTNERRSSFI